MFPLLNGVLWGAFWLNGIAGLEEFGAGTALLAAAFAGGIMLSRMKGIVPARFMAGVTALFLYVHFNSLWLAAFSFGLSGLPLKRDRYGVRTAAGFLVGSCIGGVFGCPPLLLFSLGVIHLLYCCQRVWQGTPEGRGARFGSMAVNLAGAAGVIGVAYLVFVTGGAAGYRKSDSPVVTRMCALGLSDSPDARMLVVSDRPGNMMSHLELCIASKIEYVPAMRTIPGKYDVVLVENVPADAFNTPRRFIPALKKDGILVLPLKMCAKLPELNWMTLPGGDGEKSYAAAKPGGEVEFSPDRIEENLLKAADGDPDDMTLKLLPGAFSGALTGFRSEKAVFAPGLPKGDVRIFFCVIAALLMLAEVILHKSSLCEDISVAQSSFIFAVTAGVLLCENEVSGAVKGGIWLAAASGSWLFLRLPAQSAVRRAALLMAPTALWIWFIFPSAAAGAAALIFAGMGFAFSRQSTPGVNGVKVNVQDFLAAVTLAAGIFAGSLMTGFVTDVAIVLSAMYAWLLLRS